MKYILLRIWRKRKSALLWMIVRIATIVLLPVLTAMLPKWILEWIQVSKSVPELGAYILWGTLLLLCVYLIDRFAMLAVEDMSYRLRLWEITDITEKTMSLPYSQITTNEVKEKRKKAVLAAESKPFCELCASLALYASGILGVFTYGIGIAALNPWVIIALFLSFWISLFMGYRANKWEHGFKNEKAHFAMVVDYISNKALHVSSMQDIISFGMGQWLYEMGAKAIKSMEKCANSVKRKRVLQACVNSIMILVRDGVAYGVLISQYLSGAIDIGDAVVFMALITGFSNWLRNISENSSKVYRGILMSQDIKDFLQIPVQTEVIPMGLLNVPTVENAPLIELSNVSFRYSENGRVIIKNLSLKVQPGEKIAVVGINGAGKTTLIKLLCGLLSPTEGEIYLDGKSMREYYNPGQLFSVIFQDIHLLPMSIGSNISMHAEDSWDENKLWDCIRKVRLEEKVRSLPKKEKTDLLQNVNLNAVDLSGGQILRLLIARALYKDAPVLILDEPTAAMDPVAEKQLYQLYRELSENKTSFFISHRFASTRFCDRIILMENGNIVECGTHDQLMALKGKYASMFYEQSKYYMERDQL